MIRNLGSNVTPKTVQRAAKAFGIVNQICSKFKEETKSTSHFILVLHLMLISAAA